MAARDTFRGPREATERLQSAPAEAREVDARPPGQGARGLRGHDRKVTALSMAKDGSFFASASEDATVLLWRMP